MRQSRIASMLFVAFLSLGAALSGCATVPAAARKPAPQKAIAGGAVREGAGSSPADRPLPPKEPLFRKTECNGVCVDIALDAIEDYAFTRRYVESIGRRIVLNVVYPWNTIEKGAEGEVEIHVKVDRKGTLTSSELFRGSGKPLLDNAAFGSLSAAAPFNPFPPSPYVQSLRLKATFRYFQ